MSMEPLLGTFDAHYLEKNPTFFWDNYQLRAKSNTLEFVPVKIPKGQDCESETYWKERVARIYDRPDSLAHVCNLLSNFSNMLQSQFENANFENLKTVVKWIRIYDLLCESFYRNVLANFPNKRWGRIEHIVEKKCFKKDPFTFFPSDIAHYILGFLKSEHIKKLHFVSKRWRTIVQARSWYKFFDKVRYIHGNLGEGQGYDGASVFKGCDLFSHVNGIVTGTTVIRTGKYEREVTTFWDTEGKRIPTAPIQYQTVLTESHVHTCFLDKTTVLLFRKHHEQIMIEYWKDYLSKDEGVRLFSCPLSRLNHDISRIQYAWSLNSKTVILNCYENHFQDRTYLYRFNLDEKTITKVNGSPIIEYQCLYSHLMLCRDEAGHVHLHHFNDNGAFKLSYDLGRIQMELLYDWNLHYLAFWLSPEKRRLRVYPSKDQHVFLEKIFEIDVANPDGISPFCAGFTNQPVFVYYAQIEGIYHIVLHWMNTNSVKTIPLKKNELLFEICYISDKLFVTVSHVPFEEIADEVLTEGEKKEDVKKKDNFVYLNIWNFVDCTLVKSFKLIKDTPSNFIQISRLKNGLMGILISQALYFLEFNEDLGRFHLIKFPHRVNQINFGRGVLIVHPLNKNPVIATINPSQ